MSVLRSAAGSPIRTARKLRDAHRLLWPVAKREWRDFGKTSWPEKWAMWRRGFLSTSSMKYDLDRESLDDFVSDWQYFLRVGRINHPYSFLLDNKLAFHFTLQRFARHLSKCLALARGGVLWPIDLEADEAPELRLSNLVPRHGRVVVKRTFGHRGRGIRFVHHLADDRFEVNGTPCTGDEVDRLVTRFEEVLVCEFVEQHPVFERIFPATTNAIRLLTIWDYESGAPFLAIAMARFGTSHSYPIDNGGINAPIDVSTGTIGRGICITTHNRVDAHTETGERFAGLRVPHWEEITQSVLSMCRALPQLPHVGWDVVVTKDGFKVLEGNNCPSILTIQSFSPLLRDPRMRRFYRRHGIG